MVIELRRDPQPPQPEYVRCDECGTVVLEVRDEILIIRQRHHGQVHTTVIRLEDLLRKAA